jgi:hypothetical protein
VKNIFTHGVHQDAREDGSWDSPLCHTPKQ